MSQTVNERMFDKRVVERYIKQGKITRAQYNEWLAALEDDQEQADQTETEFVYKFEDGSES